MFWRIICAGLMLTETYGSSESGRRGSESSIRPKFTPATSLFAAFREDPVTPPLSTSRSGISVPAVSVASAIPQSSAARSDIPDTSGRAGLSTGSCADLTCDRQRSASKRSLTQDVVTEYVGKPKTDGKVYRAINKDLLNPSDGLHADSIKSPMISGAHDHQYLRVAMNKESAVRTRQVGKYVRGVDYSMTRGSEAKPETVVVLEINVGLWNEIASDANNKAMVGIFKVGDIGYHLAPLYFQDALYIPFVNGEIDDASIGQAVVTVLEIDPTDSHVINRFQLQTSTTHASAHSRSSDNGFGAQASAPPPHLLQSQMFGAHSRPGSGFPDGSAPPPDVLQTQKFGSQHRRDRFYN
jgi:hypothetical protein